MGAYLSIPIMALAVIIQGSVIPQIRVFGGAPDLVFLVVLAWALHMPLEQGLLWAFVGGVLQDILSVNPTGSSSLGLVVVVFGVNLISQQVYRVGWPLLFGLTFAGTFTYQVILLILMTFVGVKVNFLYDMNYVIFPTMLYNLLFIGPVYGFIYRIQQRFIGRRRII